MNPFLPFETTNLESRAKIEKLCKKMSSLESNQRMMKTIFGFFSTEMQKSGKHFEQKKDENKMFLLFVLITLKR